MKTKHRQFFLSHPVRQLPYVSKCSHTVLLIATLVRHLCVLRTAIEQNYGRIYRAFQYDLKNLHTLPEYIPQDSIQQLSADGIEVIKANYKPIQYIIDLNNQIANRINNCRQLLPIWLKWDYLRELFIMPGGNKEAGVKKAADEYYAHRSQYPYQVYMNWPAGEQGNIFYNDKKFVSLLYEIHEDYFSDMSKVTDASLLTKEGIYRFLEQSKRCAIVVDCENSDPYKLYATLNNLNQNALLHKIAKIILYDDVHTTSAWDILNEFTDIPVEHEIIERVKENKSLVDIRLTTGTCREFFQNDTDSFILASSDSDYWGLIPAMPEAHFLVLIEEDKCSPLIRKATGNTKAAAICARIALPVPCVHRAPSVKRQSRGISGRTLWRWQKMPGTHRHTGISIS